MIFQGLSAFDADAGDAERGLTLQVRKLDEVRGNFSSEQGILLGIEDFEIDFRRSGFCREVGVDEDPDLDEDDAVCCLLREEGCEVGRKGIETETVGECGDEADVENKGTAGDGCGDARCYTSCCRRGVCGGARE